MSKIKISLSLPNRLIERKIYQKFSGIINREQNVDSELIDELKNDEVFYEGGVEQVIINKYSRSTSARQKCIDRKKSIN